MKKKSTLLKQKVKPQAVVSAVRSCKNCLKGSRLELNNDVLCREKGIVSADYCCYSHRFFILEDFSKLQFFRCCDCEFFVFHSHETINTYGVCDLFSVRKCDGAVKKACSRFVRRTAHIA